jgi:hypothetical protein
MGIVQEPRIRGTSTIERRYQATTGEDSRLKDLVHAVVNCRVFRTVKVLHIFVQYLRIPSI